MLFGKFLNEKKAGQVRDFFANEKCALRAPTTTSQQLPKVKAIMCAPAGARICQPKADGRI